jgi:ABC-type branched-subunit amino acid transport system ATPase component/ABC-type branched-subunit amino acid transport system permease subunit
MLMAFVVLATRGQRLVAGAIRDAGLGVAAARKVRPFSRGRERRTAVIATLVVVLAAIFPLLPFVPYSLVGDGILAGYYLLVALSVVLLTGWVGQISLAQAELVGVGALATALATNRLHLVFPLSLVVGALAAGLVATALGAVALRVRGLYLAIATLVFAWMADAFLFHQEVLGIVGGSASANIPNLGDPHALPYFDFNNPVFVYLIVLAAAIWVVYSVANLADSKTGRAFFALRGSEVAAASLGIDVMRYKLLAFATSGVIAGIAGSVLLVYQRSVEPSQFDILTSLFFLGIAVVGGIESLGGAMLAALFFAALNELFFRVQALAGLLDVVSAGLLLAVLLLYPGGLAALASRLGDLAESLSAAITRAARRVAGPLLRALEESRRRAEARTEQAVEAAQAAPEEIAGQPPTGLRRIFARSRRGHHADTLSRLRPEPAPPARGLTHDSPTGAAEPTSPATTGDQPGQATPPAVLASAAPNGTSTNGRTRLEIKVTRPPELPLRADQPAVLAASNVTVQFGGLTAVNDASLEVRRGEIVGLIGPNGAGKTTFFNAISGLNSPTSGSVEILGADATRLDVHKRAALGVGRTFQQIQLFPQLTVFENLLVATHLRNSSGFFGHAFALPKAIVAEVGMRARVDRIIDFLDLGDLALRSTGDLPFGNLRIIELARALVTGSELLLLDEPASGLDNTESARFADLLLYTREKLGLSMLLIEHDIATVTGVSDYMYVLEQGRIIAEGNPSAVQRNQAVIEAYLGQPAAALGQEALVWAGVEEPA